MSDLFYKDHESKLLAFQTTPEDYDCHIWHHISTISSMKSTPWAGNLWIRNLVFYRRDLSVELTMMR